MLNYNCISWTGLWAKLAKCNQKALRLSAHLTVNCRNDMTLGSFRQLPGWKSMINYLILMFHLCRQLVWHHLHGDFIAISVTILLCLGKAWQQCQCHYTGNNAMMLMLCCWAWLRYHANHLHFIYHNQLKSYWVIDWDIFFTNAMMLCQKWDIMLIINIGHNSKLDKHYWLIAGLFWTILAMMPTMIPCHRCCGAGHDGDIMHVIYICHTSDKWLLIACHFSFRWWQW